MGTHCKLDSKAMFSSMQVHHFNFGTHVSQRGLVIYIFVYNYSSVDKKSVLMFPVIGFSLRNALIVVTYFVYVRIPETTISVIIPVWDHWVLNYIKQAIFTEKFACKF